MVLPTHRRYKIWFDYSYTMRPLVRPFFNWGTHTKAAVSTLQALLRALVRMPARPPTSRQGLEKESN
ncbi:MAG: hypothetical protein CM1200mP9_05520 [Gammaproteobacteria bacterium]|nr:MAG: hypothetical protein CM1200mP9_05520 [Gammaproteobacteria bacterium]